MMREPVPNSALPIIDTHHHLYANNPWLNGGGPYLLPEFAADLRNGHNIVATVYVECSQLYRRSGSEHLRSTGEAEFAGVIARLAETGHFGPARVCEAFIGRAELDAGDTLDELIEALLQASDGRLRGIRCPATWDPDPLISAGRSFARQGLMSAPKFRAGVARLAAHQLVYEAWQFYPQLGELADLAAAVPGTTIVCGHCGGLVGRRAYSGDENFMNWKARVTELAKRPNVLMKLGGLANDRTGFGFQDRAARATEDELIAMWSPYILTCIDAFGPDRCMFESNFPVDMCAADYRTLWTVFKKIVGGFSADEIAALFAGTARRVYKLR
jgi:L-fuconolactonase